MSLNRTGIEWTEYTANPIKGLCKIKCKYCYARRIYERFKWDPEVRYVPEVFEGLEKIPPSRIFICSTHELFGHWIPYEWIQEILDTCKKNPQHTFQILTKRPQRTLEFHFPDNIWVGTTVTDVNSLINVNSLIRCDARIKFVSFEPLLEDVLPRDDFLLPTLKFIDWVIVGALTGPGRKKHFPRKEWVNNIIRGARAYKLPVFIKDNLLTLDGVRTDIEELREYPTCKFCAHWEPTCSQLIQTKTEDNICDWIPSRFVPKKSEAPASLKPMEVNP